MWSSACEVARRRCCEHRVSGRAGQLDRVHPDTGRPAPDDDDVTLRRGVGAGTAERQLLELE